MLLTILGTGGWMPAHGRQTSAVLVAQDEHALLLDAGTGVGRLVERPMLLSGRSRLDIVLTHFHLDHTCGLAYLPGLDLGAEVRIWGPGTWLYDTPTSDALRRVFAPPQLGRTLLDIVPVGDLDPNGQRIGPFRLRFRAQTRHTSPTVAIRIDDAVCYCTDTAFDPANAPFARGVAVLLHDAWSKAAEPIEVDSHATASDAARVAAEANVERLVLIHRNPQIADYTALRDEAQRFFPATDVADDLCQIETPIRRG